VRFRKTEPKPLSERLRPRTGRVSGPEQLVFAVAGEVIRKADRLHPADAALRDGLTARGGLAQAIKVEVSRAVFTYYRWHGWLANERTVERRIRRALELSERFRQNPFSLPADALRAKTVPGWVAGEVDVSDAWLRSLQWEPKLWLRAKRGQGRVLAGKLGAARKLSLPDALVYEGDKDLFRTPEFHGGEFELQDISSQAVGWLCDPRPGETWWDVCAGEGGKTLHLSDLMENKGLIWATDRVAWRLKRLQQRAARAKVFNYRTALWDGGTKLPTKTRFDGVLVDAPCSGIGTWQRNPHARWTTTLSDVKELSSVQKELLARAALLVKSGGKLIYAVCTLTRAETVEVVAAFEEQFPEFKPLLLTSPFARGQTSAQLWLWPQDIGGNGMFVAAWRRK